MFTGAAEPNPGRSESRSETTHTRATPRTRTMPVHGSQIYRGHALSTASDGSGSIGRPQMRTSGGPQSLWILHSVPMFLRRLTVPRCAENSRRGTSSFRTRRQDAPVVSAEAQGGVGHICAGVCGEVGMALLWDPGRSESCPQTDHKLTTCMPRTAHTHHARPW